MQGPMACVDSLMVTRRPGHWRHAAAMPAAPDSTLAGQGHPSRSAEPGKGPAEPSAGPPSRFARQRRADDELGGQVASMGNEASLATGPRALTVSELNASVSSLLGTLGSIRVEGELSGITVAASGHWYFSLRDSGASVRAVMFRTASRTVAFRPMEGQRVVARARLGLYESRGDFQLQVEYLEPAGPGDLFARFQALKERLASEGLFDPELKRALPAVIGHVGVVTSLGAAALHDVLTTLRARDPGVAVTIYPSLVQGAGAPAALVDALEHANAHGAADVLLLVRGGGSIEDLWSFNDETLARAIRASALPVISGVGHETDFTIADFVADVRAATPTAAATLVTSPRIDRMRAVQGLANRLADAVRNVIDRQAQHLDMAARMLQSPRQLWEREFAAVHLAAHRLTHATRQAIDRQATAFDHLANRLVAPDVAAASARLERQCLALAAAQKQRIHWQREQIESRATALALVDPASVLRRGYAIVRRIDDGAIIRSATQVNADDLLSIELGEGHVTTRALAPGEPPPASRA